MNRMALSFARKREKSRTLSCRSAACCSTHASSGKSPRSRLAKKAYAKLRRRRSERGPAFFAGIDFLVARSLSAGNPE
jgi:hypothetical protein